MTIIRPILRIYDYDKTIEFYINWLGFNVDWVHVFEPGTPRYMQISMRDIVLHLSEHHGDGSPGIRLQFEQFEGLREYHKQLIDKQYKYNRPGLEVPFWNAKQIMVTVIDPVGNRITFIEDDK